MATPQLRSVGRMIPAPQRDDELVPQTVSKQRALITSETCQVLMGHYHQGSDEWLSLMRVAQIASEHASRYMT